jgi:5-methylcytosine-specific restriction enzyme subunit McrC
VTHAFTREWGRIVIGADGFSRPQADALLAAARRHPIGGVEGTRILCDHHRHLTARQAVGVIAARGCSLEILPKVDPEGPDEDSATVRGRLVRMLDVALGLDLSVGETTAMAHRADSLLDLFIALFADRLLAEVRRGLPRRYLEQQADLGALRGRLDVARQFTAHAVRPDRLACRFDALDGDTALMRVMKACVLSVARYARAAETQRKLAELRLLLADVAEVAPNRLPWRDVRIDRTSRRWTTLLELARLLLGRRWQQTHGAPAEPEGISLLFPMNDLFERYVAVQLRRALAPRGLEVVAQGGFRNCLGKWRAGEECTASVFRTKPDILVREAGRIVAVIDTKWKGLADDPFDSKGGVEQSDVYQLMAYARVYRCDRLMLLYPSAHGASGGIVRRFGLAGGSERLDIATLNVAATPEQTVRDLGAMLGEPANWPVRCQ